jgi:hypothetical protein
MMNFGLGLKEVLIKQTMINMTNFDNSQNEIESDSNNSSQISKV